MPPAWLRVSRDRPGGDPERPTGRSGCRTGSTWVTRAWHSDGTGRRLPWCFTVGLFINVLPACVRRAGVVKNTRRQCGDHMRSHRLQYGERSTAFTLLLRFSGQELQKCISHQPSATHTHPRFDKPAFSRFSQNCEPLIVVEIVGKIVVKAGLCQKRG